MVFLQRQHRIARTGNAHSDSADCRLGLHRDARPPAVHASASAASEVKRVFVAASLGAYRSTGNVCKELTGGAGHAGAASDMNGVMTELEERIKQLVTCVQGTRVRRAT